MQHQVWRHQVIDGVSVDVLGPRDALVVISPVLEGQSIADVRRCCSRKEPYLAVFLTSEGSTLDPSFRQFEENETLIRVVGTPTDAHLAVTREAILELFPRQLIGLDLADLRTIFGGKHAHAASRRETTESAVGELIGDLCRSTGGSLKGKGLLLSATYPLGSTDEADTFLGLADKVREEVGDKGNWLFGCSIWGEGEKERRLTLAVTT